MEANDVLRAMSNRGRGHTMEELCIDLNLRGSGSQVEREVQKLVMEGKVVEEQVGTEKDYNLAEGVEVPVR